MHGSQSRGGGRGRGPRAPAPPRGPPAPLAAPEATPSGAAGGELALIPLPLRPGVGIAGTPIRLLANHFDVGELPVSVLRYQVEVIPPARPPPPGGQAPAAPRALPKALCRCDPLAARGALMAPPAPAVDMLSRASVCRSELLSDVARRRGWQHAWAYDGQATLYGARELLPDTRGGETVLIAVPRKGA